MSSSRPDDKVTDIPEFLVDQKNNRTYQRLRFFGKVCVYFVFIFGIVLFVFGCRDQYYVKCVLSLNVGTQQRPKSPKVLMDSGVKLAPYFCV